MRGGAMIVVRPVAAAPGNLLSAAPASPLSLACERVRRALRSFVPPPRSLAVRLAALVAGRTGSSAWTGIQADTRRRRLRPGPGRGRLVVVWSRERPRGAQEVSL